MKSPLLLLLLLPLLSACASSRGAPVASPDVPEPARTWRYLAPEPLGPLGPPEPLGLPAAGSLPTAGAPLLGMPDPGTVRGSGFATASQRTRRAPSVASRLQDVVVPTLDLDRVESLRSAITQLATITGISLVVTREAEEAARDAGAVFDLHLSNSVPARSALQLIVDLAGEEVAWTVKHGVVLVTTRSKVLQERLMTHSYDLRSLTTPLRDFPGPRLDIPPSGGLPAFEEEAEEPTARLTDDDLIELIRNNVDPETWEEEGVSIRSIRGVLIVRHVPEVHLKIARLIGQL